MKQYQQIVTKWGLWLIVGLMVSYPPLVFRQQWGEKAVIQYFAADTFYYLSVARHSIDTPYYTFDGQFPTNGFHPLWQYGLTYLFKEFVITDETQQITITFLLSIVFVTIGTSFFAIAVLQLTQNFALALITAVPGIYYLIFSLVEPQYDNTWAFINGMETPLSIFWFGLIMYLLVDRRILAQFSVSRVLIMSSLFTMLTVTRLDDIFIFIPFLLAIYRFSPEKRAKITYLAVAIFPPSLIIGCYLVYNWSYTGLFLPVSGLAKGGFTALPNLVTLGQAFVAPELFGENWGKWWILTSWRALQLYLPMAVALAGGLWAGQRLKTDSKRDYNLIILGGLALYVLGKGGYNAINVNLLYQGHWYFPLSIMIFNLMAAIGLTHLINLTKLSFSGSALLGILTSLFILLIGNGFTHAKMSDKYNVLFFDFWRNREVIKTELHRLGQGAGIIELDDGVISYALNLPAMSGLGLTLDPEAHQAKQNHTLLSLAYARGFRIIGSVYYLPLSPEIRRDPILLRQAIFQSALFYGEPLTQWKFSVIYYDEASGAVFIRFEPIQ